MKTNRLPLILAASIISIATHAQTHLDRWVERCEKDPAVDIMVINYRNNDKRSAEGAQAAATTNILEGKTVKITFPRDSPLLKEVTEAFLKDADNAYMSATKRENGQAADLARFRNGRTETRFSFEYRTINYGKDKIVSITAIYDYFWDKSKGRRLTKERQIRRVLPSRAIYSKPAVFPQAFIVYDVLQGKYPAYYS